MIELKITKTDKNGASEFSAEPRELFLGGQGAGMVDQMHVEMPEEWKGMTVRVTFVPQTGAPAVDIVPDDGVIDITAAMTAGCKGRLVVDAVSGEGYVAYSTGANYTTYHHPPAGSNTPTQPPSEWERLVRAVDKRVEATLKDAKENGQFDGADGADGADGVSPVVTVTEITGGHRVTITDAKGTKTFDVMDGEDGEGGTVKTVNGVSPDENGNVKIDIPDSSQNENELTTAQINALDGMFKVCSFIKDDVSAEYTAFKTAFGITDSGEDSGETEVTLSSISATYSGGDVAVGTTVADLTGIVVAAHYSDGSQQNVTDYTLSGTIAEGENTVTVTYQGITATFTVTGVAEISGDEVENNGWVDGQAYELNKVDCLSLDTSTGETVEASSGTMVTDFLPCLGVSAISCEAYDGASILSTAMYDENKNFIKANGLSQAVDPTQDTIYTYLALYNIVPQGVAYLRFTQRSSIKYLTSVTPHKYPVLTETTECETGRWYESGAVLGSLNADNGTLTVDDTQTWYVTGYCMVYGASKVRFSGSTRKTVVFYDGNKNYISGATVNNTIAFEIPENAIYMAASSNNMKNLHIWLEA